MLAAHNGEKCSECSGETVRLVFLAHTAQVFSLAPKHCTWQHGVLSPLLSAVAMPTKTMKRMLRTFGRAVS